MTKPQSIEEYKKVTGRRFRRTKSQMGRNLTPEQAFQEWLRDGSMPSKSEERAERPKDVPRIRRTKDEIRRGLTIEEAYKARKERGVFVRKNETFTSEVIGYLCGTEDRNCELPHKEQGPDYDNPCPGFKITKNEDGADSIANCCCDCHRVAFETNKFGGPVATHVKVER